MKHRKTPKPTVVSSELVFDHPWEKIYIEKLAIGDKTTDYLISVPNDFVIILALNSRHEVLMARQYRHGVQKALNSFPAGFINSGETAIACAERELLEETGYGAEEFKLLASLSENPSLCRNTYHIVLAKNVSKKDSAVRNPDEIEGDLDCNFVAVSSLLSPNALNDIGAGPMISAIPYLLAAVKKV